MVHFSGPLDCTKFTLAPAAQKQWEHKVFGTLAKVASLFVAASTCSTEVKLTITQRTSSKPVMRTSSHPPQGGTLEVNS